MKTKRHNINVKPKHLILIPIVIISLGFLPRAQAVAPAPDGGYPGGNTAEGQNALFSLTTGGYNTAVGFFSLRSNATGQFNTATGAGALLASTADQNTATGAAALLSNTTGPGNTANGAFALFSNTTGGFNTANGDSALFSNTGGAQNTATGFSALTSNTGGLRNTANGAYALANNTIGNDNTANGMFALFSTTTASENTATGSQALFSNTDGGQNTAVGFSALVDNTTGSYNTATGAGALLSNTTGVSNTATGYHALNQNTTGSANTAFGDDALQSNTTGRSNTAFGTNALGNTTGTGNIALGAQAGFSVYTADHVIAIGVDGAEVSNSCFIGNIYGVITGVNNAVPVVIDSRGQLGTMSSSARYKKEIKPMQSASESILGLKPVTFQYKSDANDTPQFGLIAEEVAKVNPNLVVRDQKGEIYTVRYDAVNAMLLNEFLKEYRKNEEQEATIAELKSGMKALAAMVNEQASQIQKVSAQLATASPPAGKPAPQVVVNP